MEELKNLVKDQNPKGIPITIPNSQSNLGLKLDVESWFKAFCPIDYKNADLRLADRAQVPLVKPAISWAGSDLSDRLSLIFKGIPGTGKSWFAFAIIRECFKFYPNSIWPRYFDATELDALLLDALWNEKERDLMKTIKECDILFLDDLGRERDTDRMAQQYFEIFNYRVMHHKPMIITTNYSLEYFNKKFSSAFGSRMGKKNFAWIDLIDDDRRG